MAKQTSTVQFKYLLDKQIDVVTLFSSQLHFIKSLTILKNELFPQAELNLYVNKTKKGSFILELLAVVATNADMFNTSKEIIEQLLGGLSKIIELIKASDGKKPEKVTINNNTGQVIIVYGKNNNVTVNNDLYNALLLNPQIAESVRQMTLPLIENPDIKGIEIKEPVKNTKYTKVRRKEFTKLTKKNPLKLSNNHEASYTMQRFYIKKFDFQPDKDNRMSSQFVYKGQNVTATIIDKKFIREINNSEHRFTKGDCLVVNLTIKQKLSADQKEFLDREYIITEVIDKEFVAKNLKLKL